MCIKFHILVSEKDMAALVSFGFIFSMFYLHLFLSLRKKLRKKTHLLKFKI